MGIGAVPHGERSKMVFSAIKAACKLYDELQEKVDRLTSRGIEDMQFRIKELEEQESSGMEATISQMLSEEQAKKWGLDEHGHRRNVQHIFMRACLAITCLEEALGESKANSTANLREDNDFRQKHIND
jgi:hypothetical protein